MEKKNISSGFIVLSTDRMWGLWRAVSQFSNEASRLYASRQPSAQSIEQKWFYAPLDTFRRKKGLNIKDLKSLGSGEEFASITREAHLIWRW